MREQCCVNLAAINTEEVVLMKRVFRTLSVLALGSMLAACGNNAGATKQADTGSEGSTQASESKSADGVANVTIWSPTDTAAIEAWWTEKIDQWNKENPDIQVKREAIDRADAYAYENKITTATTSGNLPDILYVDGPMVSYYAANGITVPLDSYFPADDLKDFMPSTVQADTYDGKLYAIAPTESSVALFYNKDYLDKAGIPYPSDTDIKQAWTWSQFLDNAKKLTTADYVGTNIIMDKGEGIIYALGQFFTEGGAQFVSDDGSKADGYINSDASVKTAEYLNEFIKNGYANLDPVKDEFLNGKAATLLGGSWNIADLEKSNLNWGVSYFPVADDGKAASPTGDWAAAITKDSKNPDAAGKFLQWAMNSDNIASYASAVAKPASRASSYDKMEGWDSGARALMKWQLQNTGVSRPRTPSYSVLSTDFSTAMLNIFSGSNAKDELDNVAKNFDENYEMYYKK